MVIQFGDFIIMKVIYHFSDAIYDNDFLVIDYLKSDKAIEVSIFTLSQTGILKVNPDPIYMARSMVARP